MHLHMGIPSFQEILEVLLSSIQGFLEDKQSHHTFFSPKRCKSPGKYSELLKQLHQTNLLQLKMYIHGLSGTNVHPWAKRYKAVLMQPLREG